MPGALRVRRTRETGDASTLRQPRYEGSVRQRRGQLLAAIVSGDEVRVVGADHDVAAGLAADGLAVLVGDRLRAPD